MFQCYGLQTGQFCRLTYLVHSPSVHYFFTKSTGASFFVPWCTEVNHFYFSCSCYNLPFSVRFLLNSTQLLQLRNLPNKLRFFHFEKWTFFTNFPALGKKQAIFTCVYYPCIYTVGHTHTLHFLKKMYVSYYGHGTHNVKSSALKNGMSHSLWHSTWDYTVLCTDCTLCSHEFTEAFAYMQVNMVSRIKILWSSNDVHYTFQMNIFH
jgi:hypothetical protein